MRLARLVGNGVSFASMKRISKAPKQEVFEPLTGPFAMQLPGGGIDAARAKAEELGIDPLELLLKFANGDLEDIFPDEEDRARVSPGMRLAAIMEATQYLHPKKKSVEFTPVQPKTPELAAAQLPTHQRRARIEKLRRVIDVPQQEPDQST